ncbi:MAG: Gx transporter family protein [Candidatus Riflebacteria bacterium]|nr:Gx transporter family protein [Candidatus Riflebacteria bacterium]
MTAQELQANTYARADMHGRTARLTLTAVLVASAAALQVVESPLPRFLPWLKPGLANAMTLYALLRLSASAAMTVAVFRTAVAAVFMGSLLSPLHLISFAGATSAAFSMTVLRKIFPAAGLAILSVFGALVNNFAQLAVVQFMFASNMSIGLHLALMIWVALPSGLIVARVTQELLRRTP